MVKITKSQYWIAAAVTILCLALVPWILPLSRPALATETTTSARLSSQHYTGAVHFDLLAKFMADDRRSKQDQDWLQKLRSSAAARVPTQPHPLLGRTAPDFTLSDHVDEPQTLHTFLEHGPVVLIFFLGSTCTACMHDLLELNVDLDRFHAVGAQVVAVSGDPSAQTRRRFEQFGSFNFAVLCDPGHTVAQAYGAVRSAQAGESAEIRHAVFLVTQDGRVQWVYTGDAPLRNNQALLLELTSSVKREAWSVADEGDLHED